jgi:hypothetical protein
MQKYVWSHLGHQPSLKLISLSDPSFLAIETLMEKR